MTAVRAIAFSAAFAVTQALAETTPTPEPAATEPSDRTVLATIGPIQIDVQEFRQAMAERGGTLPGQYAEPEQRRALLDELIQWEAQVLRARQVGYDQHPDVVRVYERVMVRRYMQDRLNGQLEAVTVTDQEVADYYAAHPEEFASPPRRQIALVFFATQRTEAEAADPAVEEKARQALAEAQALDPKIHHFGDIARRYSDDRASRYKGGVIGWLVDGREQNYKWGPEVTAAAMALEEPGEIAPIIHAEDGLYLVRLVDREAAETRPLDDVRAGLVTRLREAKEKQIKEQLDRELIDGLEIRIDESLLATIPPLGPPVPDVADRRPPQLPSK